MKFAWWQRLLIRLATCQVTGPPQVTWEHIEQLLGQAHPGDVVLGVPSFLSRFFVPGAYTHSALVVADDKDFPAVVDATEYGVTRRPLAAFALDERLGLALWRPGYANAAARQRAIDRAIAAVGTPYDFYFAPGAGRYYCHELIADCLQEAGIHVPRRRLRALVTSTELQAVCEILAQWPP